MALSLTPGQRRTRARAAAFAVHAQGRTNTGPATAAQLARFERQVLAAAAARGETLQPPEIARRSQWALKSYMTALSLKASRAKTKRETPVIEPSEVPIAGGHGSDRSA